MVKELQVRLFGFQVFSVAWVVEKDSPGSSVHLGIETEVAEDTEGTPDGEPYGFARRS